MSGWEINVSGVRGMSEGVRAHSGVTMGVSEHEGLQMRVIMYRMRERGEEGSGING